MARSYRDGKEILLNVDYGMASIFKVHCWLGAPGSIRRKRVWLRRDKRSHKPRRPRITFQY